jgi:cell filamentation protein
VPRSDPLAHAVAQTVAAQRIEGWAPTDEHLAALWALLRGEVDFAGYLAPFVARHEPPAARRRWRLGPRTPYLIPGTTVLRNEFGVASAAALAELEYVATAGRMVKLLVELTGAGAELDVLLLHRRLFADVYAWAGEPRTCELRRGDCGFAWQSALCDGLAALRLAIDAVVELGAAQDDSRLAYELARLYADYNQLHPFREGNGRAGALLLHGVAAACGRTLDFTGITRDEWYRAAADSMPFRRDGRASHRPFLYLLLPVTSRYAAAPQC